MGIQEILDTENFNFMKTIYTFIGIAFFFLEILIYEWTHRLVEFWYTNKLGVGAKATDLCNNPDAVGNCPDFKWQNLVGVFGLIGIKIIVLITFIILIKKKKIIPALLMITTYSILILFFHFDLFPIKELNKLSSELEIGNIYGIFMVIILLVFSMVSSIIFFKNKNKQIGEFEEIK